MPIIQELSSHLADLIAAGEVVERPASVVKELVENAIDAGATQITVEIEHGGISYLRIADNGIGMAPEDAPIAFRRHATSKLRTEQDLASIGTLGFRGEALAAIASVSRIDLFTKQADMLAGTHIHLEAGTITEQDDAGCPEGTTIIVRDLFFNTPARMKFLRKDFTEAGYVVSVVQHAAMSRPEIAFTMIRDGRQMFATSGKGKLIAPVFSVFGKEMTANLIEVPKFSRDALTAWGYITKPHAGRPNRSMQHFFVNGRYIKSRVMQAAFEEAYRNQIITGKYPSGAIFLTIPLHLVDVNVHPAKTEVKFAQEKAVFDTIYIACKNALEQNDNIPEIRASDSKKPAREDHVSREQLSVTTALQEADAQQTPTVSVSQEKPDTEKTVPAASGISSKEAPKQRYPVVDTYEMLGRTIKIHTLQQTEGAPESSMKLHQRQIKKPYIDADDFDEELGWDYLPQVAAAVPEKNTASQENEISKARVLGEAFHTYIVAEDEKGIVLIDKHAAHERMIFNRLRTQAEIPRQALLTPVIAEVNAAEYAALSEQLDEIRKIGFAIESFGQNSFAIREIPAYLDCAEIPETLCEMADKLMSSRAPVPDRLDDLIHTVACKSAIKAGMDTSLTEMQDFCNRVLADPAITSCPHGRPVTVRLSRYELDKMFKRVNQ
ncbi:MAG: DNA mismatch repair endonuclease MutL [Butyricicoccus pullicaecorum]|nr:DNA mismatch repair endonuclease MutL [Butyricicoccus pullicaecorum]